MAKSIRNLDIFSRQTDPFQTDPRYSDTFDLHSALREQADHPAGIPGAKESVAVTPAVAVTG